MRTEADKGVGPQWKVVVALAAIAAIAAGAFFVVARAESECADRDVHATVIKVLKEKHLAIMAGIPELAFFMGFLLMNENAMKELSQKVQVSLSNITADSADTATKTHVCGAMATFQVSEKVSGSTPIEYSVQPDQSGRSRYVVRVQW